jgi:pSer/pThr/pTyr-binding forkhead associated (FHA) protein
MRIQLRNGSPSPCVGDLCLDRFPAVIGRADDCNISIPVGFISRQHCRFIRRDDEVLVQDLESLNGTFVNGRLASFPTPIHNGDELRVGPLPFRVAFLADNRRTLADHSTPFEKTRC